MKERNKKLKSRVENARKKLDKLDIPNLRNKFKKKYPEYYGGKTQEEIDAKENRLNNLWYCKAFDEDFTRKLEAFLEYLKAQ